MDSISPDRVRTALCDQDAFYPFRNLVNGGLSSLGDLALAERFARAVVLHDAIQMEGEPMPAPAEEDEEWTAEEIAAGGKAIMVAFMPDLSPYGDLFIGNLGPDPLRADRLELSESLRDLAVEMSGAGPGDPYHDAHLKYIHRLTQTVRTGSSIVCSGTVGTALRETASRYPDGLFAKLDKDLQDFAREAHAARVGVVLPPILSIVISRINSRDQIPEVLTGLREEWKQPRERLWALIDELRTAPNVRQMRKIQKELEKASAVLSPGEASPVEPSRVLWDLVPDAAELAGGPFAVLGALIHAAKDVVAPAASYIFRRGAIDLARRVRSEVIRASEMPNTLDLFLTDQERRALTK